ncbi:hypothetical protein H4R24_001993 [Coemansia sp. RSA 988]|nr:hypothetical protein H4R24_001993 [Coemansia sp. RSA 988]
MCSDVENGTSYNESNRHALYYSRDPFEYTQNLIASRSAAENNAEPHWARMLIDTALLQALEYFTRDMDGQVTLVVLNNLDRALIIGAASGEQLKWIQRVVKDIEGTSTWLQTQIVIGEEKQKFNDPNQDYVANVTFPDMSFPLKRYSVDEVDMFRFQQMISDSERSCPFIIEGATSFWPALSRHKWSNLSYMRRAVGHHRLVPIEQGKKYTDEQWSQKLVSFGEFLDNISNSSGSDKPCDYLAQHNLLKQAPALKRDFILPDYTQVETGRRAVSVDVDDNVDGVVVNIWIGPSGTISPLHYDNFDNLFAQIFGYKYFRLYSHRETANLYPYPPGTLLVNTSQVDVESPDIKKHPRAENAHYLECVVKPGDLLYIPPRWWHYVRSLSTSASISMWF